MQIVILDYLPLTTLKTLRIILIFQLEISRLRRICYIFYLIDTLIVVSPT